LIGKVITGFLKPHHQATPILSTLANIPLLIMEKQRLQRTQKYSLLKKNGQEINASEILIFGFPIDWHKLDK